MSIGAKDYGLIGYNIVSDLVDMADLDGTRNPEILRNEAQSDSDPF